MPRRRRTDSPYTAVALELAEELRQAREDARDKAAQFMHHDVSPSEMLRRAERMTPAQRRELPPDDVIRAIRSLRSREQPDDAADE